MHNNLTNLLPLARQKQLVREYMFRLGVVMLSIFIVCVFAAGVFLIPTYVFLTGSANAKEVSLENLKSKLSSADEVSLSNRLAALSKDATALTLLSKRRTASTVLRSVLAVPRPGVSVSAITFTPIRSSIPNTLALSGTTTTRDNLRNYQLALQAQPVVLSAELPVSVYAKDTDIDFTITVTLKP